MATVKIVICPYCGESQPQQDRCRACRGQFESLSRRASQNEMGPWYIRMAERPFLPGCSYEKLVHLIDSGRIDRYTIIRGPTTRQFWTVARHVPGIAHLLGHCHQCDARVERDEHSCPECGAVFGAYLDRNYLGLAEITAMPWDADGFDDAGPNAQARWAPHHGHHPRGLSAFASDAELTAPIAHAHEPAPAAPAEAPASPPDDSAASSVVGALRRRVDEQRRTIRLLAILLAGTVLIGMGLGVVAFRRPAPDGGVAEQPLRQPEGYVPSRDRPAPSPDEASSNDAATETGSVAPGEVVALIDEYHGALQLIDDATDTAKSLRARIDGLDDALAILESLTERGFEHEDLDETLKSTRTEVERLRLELFFP